MSFCLPTNLQQKFLAAVKDGTLDPSKLIDMTDAERRTFLEGIVGKENAESVNALIESKLLLKDQERGLVTAVKKITGLSDKVRADFVDKIGKLDKVLTPDERSGFLADLAAQKLGTTVTLDEATKITELGQKAKALREQPTENLSGVSDEYLKAADDLRSYIASLKPTSAIASIGKNAAIIARNNLLMNPATPFKTSLSQFANSIIDHFTRRIGTLTAQGLNGDLAAEASKEAWQTYKNTGLNTASMENLDDTGKLGEGTRFDVPTGVDKSHPVAQAVEAGVRKVAQVSNKIAIDWEHNISFTKFYQKAFFDMANILSTKLAKDAGGDVQTRAAEIFQDAARVQPKTDTGAMVRAEAQKAAARVTSTNDTFTGNLALGVKDALNKAVTGLGDAVMPIAKIPANIIANGLENAGLGIPKGVMDIFKGRQLMQSDDLATRYKGMAQLANGVQTLARTFGVLGVSAYFASQLTKQDFKTDAYGDNFVKIGNVWVNMQYISAISPALAGMMMVKKNYTPKQGALGAAGEYVAGAASSLKGAPGVSEVNDLVTSITNSNLTKGIEKYASTFFTSRGEPAFIKSLTSGTPIKSLFFSTTGLPTTAELHKLQAK